MTFVKLNHPNTRNFDGLINNFFTDPASFPTKINREFVPALPPVNIAEADTAYYLDVAAPGLDKTDFTLKAEGNLLTIGAAQKETSPNETLKQIKKEFSSTSFTRSFTLDEKIDATNISAKYENGILKVVLPKKEAIKIDSKEITIQ